MTKSEAPLGAVDLEIIKASLSGIVQEMQNSLFRTGFSTIVRESQDASCAILDTNADVIAQHVVLPLHMGAFPACCAAVIKAYSGDIVEGDAYLINHPYEGGSPHAPDMALLSPVFCAGLDLKELGDTTELPDISPQWPPMNKPVASPAPEIAPNTPNALRRSSMFSNVVVSSASADGARIAGRAARPGDRAILVGRYDQALRETRSRSSC